MSFQAIINHPKLWPVMSAGAAAYSASAVHFDGAAWLHIASLTSLDNSYFSFAGWMKLANAQFNLNSIFTNNFGSSSSAAFFGVSDKSVALQVGKSDGSASDEVSSNAAAVTPDQWACVIGTIDSSASSKGRVYVGDVDVTNGLADSGIPFNIQTNGLTFGFCNDNFGDFVTGDFADWRIMPGTSLLTAGDIPLATRRLFINALGKPVNPAVATAALGSPCMLFSGDHTTFPVNQGSGGLFTLTGVLTNAGTSPSN